MATFTPSEISNYIDNIQTLTTRTHLSNDLSGLVDTGLTAIIDTYSEFIITNYFNIIKTDISLVNSLTKYVDYLNQLEEIRLADSSYMSGDNALKVIRYIYYLDYFYYKFITPVNQLFVQVVPPIFYIRNYRNDFIRTNLTDDFINLTAPTGLNNIINEFSPIFAQRLGNSALSSDEVNLIRECLEIFENLINIIGKHANGQYDKSSDYMIVLLNCAIIDSVYNRIFVRPIPAISN